MFHLHCDLPGCIWAILESMRGILSSFFWSSSDDLKGGRHFGLSRSLRPCPGVRLHVEEVCCRSAVIWKGIVIKRRWCQLLLMNCSFYVLLPPFFFFVFLNFYPSISFKAHLFVFIQQTFLLFSNGSNCEFLKVFISKMVPSECVPLSQMSVDLMFASVWICIRNTTLRPSALWRSISKKKKKKNHKRDFRLNLQVCLHSVLPRSVNVCMHRQSLCSRSTGPASSILPD